MNRSNRRSVFAAACIGGAATLAVCLALGQPEKGKAPAPKAPAHGAQPEMQLPPGWTSEDMQACMAAGTPGKMHEFLAKQVGEWHGKTQMWMAPGTEPMMSECVSKVTSIMDGRYVKMDMTGDMPGMGPMVGMSLVGFDNVSQKFVGTWIDNQGTGMMQGEGELSNGEKTLTWNYKFNCPITKKQAVMREVETYPNDHTMTLDMFTADPKTGKEYKMMHIDFTKKGM